MALPVSQVGELLLGADWAEVAWLTFVNGVSGIFRIEGLDVGKFTCLGMEARFTVQFCGDDAIAD